MKWLITKSHQVFQQQFKRHGIKQIAGKMKYSTAFLYKWTHLDGGKAAGGWNPLERLVAFMLATGDLVPLHWLCAQFGGHFLLNPAVLLLPPKVLLIRAAQQGTEWSAELVRLLAKLEAGERLKQEEGERFVELWEQVKPLGESVAACFKQGRFGKLLSAGLLPCWPMLELAAAV
jgi:hypothetical protein